MSVELRVDKPPLGVEPRWIAEERRIVDLMEAWVRYSTSGTRPKPEWDQELLDLLSNRIARTEAHDG